MDHPHDSPMKSRRWLTGVDANTTLADAACIALGFRLPPVLKRLGGVRDAEGADRIRRLRVAIRRASVALRAFEPALPAKRARRLRSRLNRIRRCAGRLRDCDVHLALVDALFTDAAAIDAAAVAHVREAITGARAKRQRQLLDLLGRRTSRITRCITRILVHADCGRKGLARDRSSSPTLLDAARPFLTGILSEVRAAARADTSRPDSIHELRIAARRLRYALELFAAALPEAVRNDLYPRLIDIQDHMGKAGDLQTFLRRLQRLTRRARVHCEDESLARRLQALTDRCHAISATRMAEARAFLRARGLHDLDDIERHITDFLASPGAPVHTDRRS